MFSYHVYLGFFRSFLRLALFFPHVNIRKRIFTNFVKIIGIIINGIFPSQKNIPLIIIIANKYFHGNNNNNKNKQSRPNPFARSGPGLSTSPFSFDLSFFFLNYLFTVELVVVTNTSQIISFF